MSDGTAEVMQSYLVKLGYKTDFVSLKKFEDGLSTTGKSVFAFGGKVAAVVASVEAASAAFAFSMRSNFFKADLAGSSIQSLKALSLAGKQAGVDAGTLTDAVTTMNRKIRDSGGDNGGTAGLIRNFGVDPTQVDKTLTMLQTIKSIQEKFKDSPFVGQKYAEDITGLTSDQYKLVTANLDKLISTYTRLVKLQQGLGMNGEALRKPSEEWVAALEEMGLRAEGVGQQLLHRTMPLFKEFTTYMNDTFDQGMRGLQSDKSVPELFVNGLKNLVDEGMQSAEDYSAKKEGRTPRNFAKERSEKSKATTGSREQSGKVGEAGYSTSSETSLQTLSEKKYSRAELKAMSNKYEKKYGLEENLLYGQMGAESNFNDPKWLKSPKGAEGPMGIMPKTQKEFGVNNPYDVEESLDKMGLKMKGLKRWAGGDLNKALGAYNAGEGNYLKRGNSIDGQAQETRDYVGRVNSIRLGASQGTVVTQNNNVNINVTGTGAEATAQAVSKAQTRVLADATRNLGGSTQ